MADHKWVKSTLGHGESMCQYCLVTDHEAEVLNVLNYCDKAPAPHRTRSLPSAATRIQALEAEVEELRTHLRQLHFTVSSVCHLRGKQVFGDQLRQMHEYLEGIRPLIGGQDLQQTQTKREPEQLCEDEGCPHHGTPHICR